MKKLHRHKWEMTQRISRDYVTGFMYGWTCSICNGYTENKDQHFNKSFMNSLTFIHVLLSFILTFGIFYLLSYLYINY
jgi:hypothetical protein